MNLRTLDLNLLRVFDAVYGARSVGAAAAILGMRQSAVSSGLARLRELSHDPLFVRAGQGVAPTPRADAMAGPIRAGLARLDGAFGREITFDPSQMTRRFRIATHEIADPLATRGMLAAIANEAPSALLDILTPGPGGLASQLLNGEIDAAVDPVPIHSPQITCLPLFRVRHVCAARPGWTGRNGPLDRSSFSSAPFAALKTQLRAQDIVDRALAARTGPRRILYETASYWSMVSIVAMSELLAVMPKIFLDEVQEKMGVEQIPLPFDLPDDVGYLIWHERDEQDQAHRWMREHLIDAFGRTSEGVAP